MPYLYGQPFKNELREEISKLNRELSLERKERRLAQDRLIYAKAKIRELESRLEGIDRQAKDLSILATKPVDINFAEEKKKEIRKIWDAMEEKTKAEA
jgi:hypothetical protein